MASYLKNKRIIVGITGGIAAYKAAELVRMLKRQGSIVRVVMTPSAQAFITPLTLQALSGLPVHTDLLDEKAEAAMGHIELAKWADLIIIAPASADFMARFVHGHANDLLTAICLASDTQFAMAPAMNQQMWASVTTQENIHTLKKMGVLMLGPASGEQACGDVGLGRMVEPIDIVDALQKVFATDLFAGVDVLMTAGPTQEPIDPVRYLSNHSSGKMGYALAQALSEAGANVTLVSGPVSIAPPERIDIIYVKTAQQMYDAVFENLQGKDIFVSTAAVADYHVKDVATQKIKKTKDKLTLELVKNPDILKEVAAQKDKLIVIGFAAETEDLINKATQKMQDKNLDMIVANIVGVCGQGFQADDNQVTLLTKTTTHELPLMSKNKLARELVKLFKEGIHHETD